MDKLIANFTKQLTEAVAIGNKVSAPKQVRFDNILCCGLGGSGIGAKITKLLNRDYLSVPFDTTNDYNIPSFVNEKTLVIATSYSGDTEETLMAIEACITKGATIAVITSGGTLLEMAKENNWHHYIVPGGEQPRAMLAYSLVIHFFILKAFNLINYDFIGQIEEAVELLNAKELKIQEEGKVVATACLGKIPAIYANPTMEGVAVRFRQQLNENSKMLAWNAVIPEMNHNELVGWTGGGKNVAVIKLSNSLEFYRNTKRWEFCNPVIEANADSITEVKAEGNNVLTQALYLIHLTDWASYYLAELKGIDATEVDVIMSLKSKLSDLK
ncbi:MAG: bifunctional phosphoglucose/phosphomannose isomerase [Crocinitomicaceae bacterium]